MKLKIVGLGEVLWDMLPGGKQMGGAPANFACHAAALGADARIVSRVGDDDLGRELIGRLKSLGLPTDGVEIDPAAPTSTVSVKVDAAGQPQFTIHEGVAWDRLTASETALSAVAAANAICFGSLAQRSEPARASIQKLVQASRANALRIFDINLRQHYFSREVIEQSLRLANVLKVNETELPVLAEMFSLGGGERAQIEALAQSFQLRAVAFTRGGRGSLLHADGRWSAHPGVPVKVADTVGAGDSFTAAMTLGLLRGWDLDLINRRANELAAHVASCPGATPPLPETIRSYFHP